jgi:hypothetical protein
MPRPTSACLFWSLLTLSVTSGCGSSTDPSGLSIAELLVQTDKAIYSMAHNEPVKITVINHGSSKVFFLMGDYVYIEQASDNGWIYRGPWFFVDGMGMSFSLAPGDSMEVLPMDMAYVNRAGVYRFVFQASLDQLMRRMLPKEERVSEPFTVTW